MSASVRRIASTEKAPAGAGSGRGSWERDQKPRMGYAVIVVTRGNMPVIHERTNIKTIPIAAVYEGAERITKTVTERTAELR